MAEKRKDNKGRILRDNEYQRKDGKYEYKYQYLGKRCSVYSWRLVSTDRMPPGKRHEISLREKEKNIRRDMEDGIDTDRAAKMTMNDLLAMYLESKTKLREKTKEKYQYLCKLHIKESWFGNMMVGDIKKANVKRFYAEFGKDHADAYVRMLHNNLIRPALEFAVDNDIIRKNPTKGCLEGYDGTRKRVALTREQQRIFLAYVGGDDHEKIYQPMIQVMLGTAARVSEICGLTWKDVDMKNRMIRIDHQINYEKSDEGMKHFISKPKTESGIRDIPMTDQVYKALLNQKKLNILLGRRGDYELDGYSNFVFLNSNQRPYTYRTFNYILYGIVRRYNDKETQQAKKEKRKPVLLPNISNHILRHTGCTRMAESGMDVKVLQVIMGHSDAAVTLKVYDHVDKERMKKEIQKIENVI